jgi:hypothetical protein
VEVKEGKTTEVALQVRDDGRRLALTRQPVGQYLYYDVTT